jgi:NAD(P)-dependent dehydrogenase (short-subunit alcohol dehydrogenase family)
MRFVITGANRGIGLEFVRQLLFRGDTVDAGVRAPAEAQLLQTIAREAQGRLRILPLELQDPSSIQAFAAAVGETPVDVLVNNAGVMGKWLALPELDYEDVARTFAINALAPLRLTGALLPALLKGSTRKAVHITSRLGSLHDNAEGGLYAYRMSKAALNMGVRSMAQDFRAQGLLTAVINPGWVKTDMGGPDAPLRAEESVRGMLEVIDRLGPEQSGRFLDFQGKDVPW